MSRYVDISSQLINPQDGKGNQLSALTVNLRNQLNVLKDSLTYPGGISQSYDAGTGYTYTIQQYDVSDTDDWPGIYVIAEFVGTDQASGQTITWYEYILFDVTVAIPTVDEGREPYADLAFAVTYFVGLRRGDTFMDLIGTEPATAYKLLVEASDDLDTERYKGQKLRIFAYDQSKGSRQFPRVFNINETVGYFAGTNEFIPYQIQQATCEQALWIYQQEQNGHDYESRSELQARGLSSTSRGKSSESYDLAHAKRTRICQRAYEIIHPFLAQAVPGYTGTY